MTREEKRARRIEKLTRLAARALPSGHYTVLLADPPWHFETWSEAGLDRHPSNHYPTMATEEICALEVPAARDAVLFLWATFPMLASAWAVMQAWGFDYRSGLAWDKQADGTGYWTRSRVELLLIGCRGGMPAPAFGDAFPGLVSARRTRHSEKPAAVADLITERYPSVPKLELFARQARPGWTVWGNEVVG